MDRHDFNIESEKHCGEVGQWTLCIGAGITRKVVPTWFELTRRVVNEAFEIDFSEEGFEKAKNDLGWSLDSWIQAAANMYLADSDDTDQFHFLLEQALYEDLLVAAEQEGLRQAMATALNNPRNVQKDETVGLANFLEAKYGDTSLVRLSKLLIECAEQDRLPQAVITFNADTLLHTTIELLQRRDHYRGNPPYSHPEYHFTTILRSMGGRPESKVPIYHLHGAIKPEIGRDVVGDYDSRDKLIFLEDDYLSTVTGPTSWAQTIFTYHSQTSSLVLVGLSLSDPNIRRWLSSSSEIMTQDVSRVSGVSEFTPSHIWVTSKPDEKEKRMAKAVGLSHLGVRVGWLPNWDHLKQGLRNMIAL